MARESNPQKLEGARASRFQVSGYVEISSSYKTAVGCWRAAMREAEICRILTDAYKYAHLNYHAPPVRRHAGNQLSDVLRVDRAHWLKAPTEKLVNTVKHDKTSLIQPLFSTTGQAVAVGVALATVARDRRHPALESASP